MKGRLFLLMGLLCFSLNAQSLNDVIRYSQTSLSGSARFNALSGAFGALGGELSAISINPASSSVFLFSELSVTANTFNNEVTSSYFGNKKINSLNGIDLSQAGIVLVLKDEGSSKWSKISFGFNYQVNNNFDTNIIARGNNSTKNGIDKYFLYHSMNRNLDDISQINGESFREAYINIGEQANLGYSAQQALFGYEGYVINPVFSENPNEPNDPLSPINSVYDYTSNTEPLNNGFYHEYFLNSFGINRLYTFNISGSFKDKFYFGLNVNSHRFDYTEKIDFYESNYASDSGIKALRFNNYLTSFGEGGSFQIGSIYKLNSKVRLGLVINSPVYYTINESLSQFLVTDLDNNPNNDELVLDPETEIFFPEHKLNTAGSLRGSFAFIISPKGLISIDYTRKNYSGIRYRPGGNNYLDTSLNNDIRTKLTSNNTFQIGGEMRLNSQISLRAGYLNESSSSNLYDNSITNLSLGIGYAFSYGIIDLSYQNTEYNNLRPIFNEGLVDPIGLSTTRNNYVITYRLKL